MAVEPCKAAVAALDVDAAVHSEASSCPSPAGRAGAAARLLLGKAGVGTQILAAGRLKSLPQQRWRTDLSTFSALNVEAAPTVPTGSPFVAFRRDSTALLRMRPAGLSAPEHKDKVWRHLGTDETRVPDSDTDHNSTFASHSESDSDHCQEPSPLRGPFESVRKYLLGARRALLSEEAPPELTTLRALKVDQPGTTAPSSSEMARQVTPMSRQITLEMMRQVTQDVSMSRQATQEMARQMTPMSRQVTPMSRQVTQEFTRQLTQDFLPGARATVKSPSERPFGRAVSESAALPAATPPPARLPKSPQEELKRTVQGLLNKACPENVATIVQKIAGVEIKDTQQLETVIELIFKKALAEPHYCETYADLVFNLKSVFPEFPSPDGGKPITFKSSVLNICQNEFEQLLTTIEPSEEEKAQFEGDELELCRKKRKDRMLANMKFIGHLYLRQLLSAKVIGSVSRELVYCDQADQLPVEHALECCCELLLAIGYTLEAQPAGQSCVQQVCSRLLELKVAKTAEGKPRYSKRVQFMVQDLLDTRAAGWSKKVFKSAAKTKEEIRMEQERDLQARQSGCERESGEHVVAGQRPVYLAAVVGA